MDYIKEYFNEILVTEIRPYEFLLEGPNVSPGRIWEVFFRVYYKWFPAAFFQKESINVIGSVARNYAMFSLSRNIRFKVCPEILEKQTCILLCHHRRDIMHLDMMSMFSFGHFKKFKVIIDFNTKSFGHLRKLLRTIFGAIELRDFADKNFAMAQSLLDTETILIIFPDRDGSQFLGDTSMTFRTGAFATALAMNMPVYEMRIFEPTPCHSETSIEVLKLKTHGIVEPLVDINSETFQDFKGLYKDKIQELTHLAEIDYKAWISEKEQQFVSCPVDPQAVCSTKEEDVILKSISRNTVAMMAAQGLREQGLE